MNLHMFLQVARLTESSATSCADVRSLPGVKPPVNNHFVPCCECFPTEFTTIRPRVSVNSLMFTQQIPSLKVFGTKGALERSLVSMNTSDMKEQLSLPSVARSTNITYIRLFPCVSSSVLIQVPFLTKRFLTEVTLEWSVSCMYPHVRFEIGFLCELLATNFTAMSISLVLRTMNPRMNLQNLHSLEALLTHLTLKILSLFVDKIVSLLQIFWWIILAAVFTLDQKVFVYQMLPPVTLHLGHRGARVVTAQPVTPVIKTFII